MQHAGEKMWIKEMEKKKKKHAIFFGKLDSEAVEKSYEAN